MNENVPNPAEKYAGATAVAKPSEDKATYLKQKYGSYEAVNSEDVQRKHSEIETERALKVSSMGRPTEKHTAMDWVGDAARATILGPLGEAIGAQYLSMTNEGVSYKQALAAVRQNRKEKGVSGSATLVGAIIGGGAIYKGGKAALTALATKNGMVDGAMKWAVSSSRTKRIAASAAAGAGVGATEEFIRTSIQEGVDASGGLDFDGDRIVTNTVQGSLMAAAASPMFDGAVAGGKWLFDYYRRLNPESPQAAMSAAQKTLKIFKEPDETIDAAAARWEREVAAFESKHKRKPAMAEIMAPEKAEGIAEVAAFYAGLDTRAGELAEKGVERALKELDAVALNGEVQLAPHTIYKRAQQIVNHVVKTKGNTPVEVDRTTMTGLYRRQGLINTLADEGNKGAQKIKAVLDSARSIDDLTSKMNTLKTKREELGQDEPGALGLAGLQTELADLMSDLYHARGGKEVATDDEVVAILEEVRELRNTMRLYRAAKGQMTATNRVASNDQKIAELQPLIDKATAELQAYKENGMKISLSDANNIRTAASKRANAFRLSDPDKASEARAMRDLVGPIGVKEVPEYGDAIKRFNLQMIRGEGQDVGEAIATGKQDLDELSTILKTGQIPGRPAQARKDQRGKLVKGAGEGFLRNIQNKLRDTPRKGVEAARQLSESKMTQAGGAKVLGKEQMGRIKEQADQTMKAYEGFKAMARPNSVSELAEERRVFTEVATGAVSGRLGGAGLVAYFNRLFQRMAIPRGTATKMIDMLGKPGEMDDALRIMQKKGIRLGPLAAAILAGTGSPEENTE
jgi:hypothetical protein